jgi:hypothetical protein
MLHLQQIREWFTVRVRKSRKQRVKYGHKWTAKQVFTGEHADEIRARTIEASGSQPGEKGYIGHLHPVIKEMMDKLSSEEVEALKGKAETYSSGEIPREVQIR